MKQEFEWHKNNSQLIADARSIAERKKQKKIAAAIFNESKKNSNASNRTTKKCIAQHHALVNEILALASRPITQQPKKVIKGLIQTIVNTDTIHFVTIAGVASTQEKQEAEAHVYDQVKMMLNGLPSLNDISWEYSILLSFHSEAIQNKKIVAPHTNVPVMYPSEFFDKQSMFSEQDKLRINTKVNQILPNNSIRTEFSVSDERITKNVRDYALFGKQFEECGRSIVLLDLQKRIFPYQQPCYQILRQNPLPVISMQTFVNKIKY